MNKEQLTIVGLLAVLGFDLGVHFRNKSRIRKLVDLNTKVIGIGMSLDKENDYLRSILDEHEVPATEFDQIVLNLIHQED